MPVPAYLSTCPPSLPLQVQIVLEVISVATTVCIALRGPAAMAQHHAVLAWGQVTPSIFLMLAQRTQW